MHPKGSSEDSMLISQAKQGNKKAFENLTKKYQQAIYSICIRMTGTHQSADDLSQDTFVKAYFALTSFKDHMNFFTWIRKIAVNSTLNYLKTQKKEVPLYEGGKKFFEKASSSQEQPHLRLERRQMKNQFQEAIQSLSPEQKSVFILRTYENLSYKEISQILRISPGTVMSRLSRARKILQQTLAEYL